jgi:hypothetical protein
VGKLAVDDCSCAGRNASEFSERHDGGGGRSRDGDPAAPASQSVHADEMQGASWRCRKSVRSRRRTVCTRNVSCR